MTFWKYVAIIEKRKNIIIEHKKINNRVKKYVEEMNISQSKLSIGCKISNINDFDRNYVLPIYSIILGGGSSSKLFNNVREKNSLCYYISASGNKLDNILFITSGINAKNYDKCLLLIKKELKNMQKGNFTEDDIEKAKTQYITMLDELWEDPFQIISFYYSIGILNKDDYDTRKKNIMSVKYEDIKRTMFLPANDMVAELKNIFAECGIAFEVVQHFTGAPVQGFIQKRNGKVVLCMTIRQSFSDIFWFTLFHEIGHLTNDDFANQYIDYQFIESEEEKAADKFARNMLINQNDYEDFIKNSNISLSEIKRFADSQNVKPCIVIGRIQNDINDYSFMAKYRERYKWSN